MWQMLQLEKPDDFVISSGETHSIRELLEIAFSRAGLEWGEYVVLDPRHLRPAEVDVLIGDSTKARETFGWKPTVGFRQLVEMMVDSDIELAFRERDRSAGQEGEKAAIQAQPERQL
jgi:GDPmannose 4,6-dehydratase